MHSVVGLLRNHGARREVHCTRHIADKRQINGVVGVTTFVVFQTANAFVGEQIGIFHLYTRGLIGSVEVNELMMLGCLAHHIFVVIYYILVVAVHKVDFASCYAPLFVGGKEVHIILHGCPWQPEDEFHIFAVAIADEFGKVDGIDSFKHMLGGLGPTFVENDVRHAVFRGKIDEILIGGCVDTAAEVHIFAPHHFMIPPVPSHLPGAYPRGVEVGLLCQSHIQGALEQTL